MGYFNGLFNQCAVPLLESAFSVDMVLYPASRKSQVVEGVQFKGLLYDPSTKKQIVLREQYLEEMTSLSIRIHKESAAALGVTTITLRDAQVEVFGDKFLVKAVSTADEIYYLLSLERVSVKVIEDRGRREY